MRVKALIPRYGDPVTGSVEKTLPDGRVLVEFDDGQTTLLWPSEFRVMEDELCAPQC